MAMRAPNTEILINTDRDRKPEFTIQGSDFKGTADINNDGIPDVTFSSKPAAPKKKMSGKAKFLIGVAVLAGAASIAAGALGLLAYAGVAGAVSALGAVGLTQTETVTTYEEVGGGGGLGGTVPVTVENEVVNDAVLPVAATLTGVGAATSAGAAYAASKASHASKVNASRASGRAGMGV